MRTLKNLILAALCLGVLVLAPVAATAQDATTETGTDGDTSTTGGTTDAGDTGTTEGPSFSNPAQAAKAAALAEAAAAQPNPAAEQAAQDLDAAQASYDAAVAAQDPAAIAAAEAALAEAQAGYDSAMSQATGVSVSDISSMRDMGMGWGQIAHELGVHPGVLGLGQAKKSQTGLTAQTQAKGLGQAQAMSGKTKGLTATDRSMAGFSSTSRNAKTGRSNVPGAMTKGDSESGKSIGMARASNKSAGGSTSGNSGGKSGGSSGGKGGSSGSGGGGGKGGGNSGGGGGKGGGNGKK